MDNFIPFALPIISDDEINSVVRVMRSGWLTTGKVAAQFEQDFANFIGVEHAIAVNSATAGLHLALEAIGIGPGDKVITSVFTFTATAEVIRYLGADPVFVDIDPDTCNISIKSLENTLSEIKGVKAIMPVHFAGQSCDMDPILDLAKAHDIKIVEDAAHALPCTYNDRKIGTIGDITVYSFYATKTITTGEGGMIVTNNNEYAERIRIMRLHGISKDAFDRYTANAPQWYYEVVAPGFKYNMPDIAAAIGIEQLKKANEFCVSRKHIADSYNNAFNSLPLQIPKVDYLQDTHSWHLYTIQLDLSAISIDRDRFIELMFEHSVGVSVHFIPLHIQPYWSNRYKLHRDDFPNAYKTYKRIVSLPIYPKMSDIQVHKVIVAVTEILAKYTR